MKLSLRSRGHIVDPWDDDPSDSLPSDLAALVAADASTVDAAVARRRAIVLAAYRAAALDTDARPVGRRALFPQRRRWAFALVTAVLTLAMGVAGVAASGAGGPLYPLRLATEEAFLPAEASARLAGQLDRLGRRVQEAEMASARGDRGALAAALGAYEAIARDVEAGRPETLDLPTEQRNRFRDQVSSQLRRLQGLEPFDPAAIGQAVDAGTRVESRVQSQNRYGPGGGQGDAGSPVTPVTTPQPSPTSGPAVASPAPGPHGPSSDPGHGGTGREPSGLGGRPDPGDGWR
jgi:hypothetical protein